MNVWRGAVFLKEEKIEHESDEDSLKGTTEPTTVRPIVSLFPSYNSSSDALQVEKKKKKKKTDYRRSASLEVRNAQNVS